MSRLGRAITLVVAAFLLWLVLIISVAGALRNQRPDWVLALAPFDAGAKAATAERSLTGTRRPHIARARQYATAALRRDPTSTDAVTALGLSFAFGRDGPRAERSFQYAARLSRRDTASQLWLLERNVQQNDVVGALTHYDIVLRTSPSMHATLFPILASASAEPGIAPELNRLLRRRPPWKADFISTLIMSQPNAAALYRVTRGLLRPDDPREREQLATLLKRLAELRSFDLAWRANLEVRPERRSAGPGLWNGSFDREPGLGPFDWAFSDDPMQLAERRPHGSDGFALYLPVNVTNDLEAARQLVGYRPGRYAIAAVVGSVPADEALRPQIAVRCAGEGEIELVRKDFPGLAEDRARMSTTFEVPESCRYQWVSIWVRGVFDRTDDAQPWVSLIRITEL